MPIDHAKPNPAEHLRLTFFTLNKADHVHTFQQGRTKGFAFRPPLFYLL